MTRLNLAATAASIVCATALTASAQSQAEIASRLNDEGKALMYEGKYAEASAKFRDAGARVPEPKYFFNLCTSNYQQGKFDEAITACNAADKHSPSPELATKISKLVDRIKSDAKEQNITLHPTGGGGGDPNLPPGDPNNPPGNPNNPPGDPNNPPGDPNNPGNPTMNPGYTPAVGRPPQQGLFTGVSSDNNYTWTLGIDVFGGGGTIGRADVYGNSAFGFRIKGDYILRRAQRIGAQVYLQHTSFGKGEDQVGMGTYNLSVIDLGIAAYKHFCLPSFERLCVTPLAGVQLALMSPANQTDGYGETVFNYSALGARLELGAHFALGGRMEHVIGVAMGINAYSAVFSEPTDGSGLSAMQWGLDEGGAAGYLAVGYTYRFSTPLGSSPFVTLE